MKKFNINPSPVIEQRPMKNVIVYSSPGCTFCVRAKGLLESLNISTQSIDLSLDPDLAEKLSKKYNWRTVPMIFIGDEFIGGYDDLVKLNDSGELSKKIAN